MKIGDKVYIEGDNTLYEVSQMWDDGLTEVREVYHYYDRRVRLVPRETLKQ